MKRVLPLLAFSFVLGTSGFSQLPAASDVAVSLPVLTVTQLEAPNPGLYANQIAAINAVMKTKFGVDPFLRVYVGDSAGEECGTVFAVTRAESFAALTKNAQGFLTDPALADLRASLDAIRDVKSRMNLKAVRFDGGHPNAWLYNTYANVNDEAGYLKALGELTTQLKSRGFEDARLNVYRVIAGRSTYTHLISFNLPSSERLAALLDLIANEAWVAEWIAASAKFRTIVHNGTYHEISR